MSLIDKFSTVEINANNRISEDDKAFCLSHQEAFDKSGPTLGRIAEAITAAKVEQQTILGGKDDQYPHLSPWGVYISHDGFKCDEESIYEMLEKRNSRFIHEIVNYFSRKYTVELDESAIAEHLIPADPQEPELPLGGYRKMTDEEVDVLEEKYAAYKAAKQKHGVALRTLPLRYEQIVDEIFVQLGGFSFQERAMNEFLSKCWNASHTQRWNETQPKENFEIKNDTLRLTGYWCHCKDDSWRSYPEWVSSKDLKVVLNALVHFDIGQLNRGAEWFPKLFQYSTKENVFSISNLKKAKNIKLFKNGRVDIKFRDAVTVQEFVENYLRKQIGGTGNVND